MEIGEDVVNANVGAIEKRAINIMSNPTSFHSNRTSNNFTHHTDMTRVVQHHYVSRVPCMCLCVYFTRLFDTTGREYG